MYVVTSFSVAICMYLHYSMEGSVAKLHEIVELKKKYKVSLIMQIILIL